MGVVMDYDINSIAENFKIIGTIQTSKPFGSGHINDTFLVSCGQHEKLTHYVLQRINHEIFKNPPALMQNVIRVTDHIRAKVEIQDKTSAERQLTVIRTLDDTGCCKDTNGNFWRMYNLIDKAVTYDEINSPELAFEAARMFGWFQKMLIDMPGGPLHETIPDFHNTPKRLKSFKDVLGKDPCNRAVKVKDEIEFVLKNSKICSELLNLVDKGKIPIRVTHNDTKINNVMLDQETDRGVCVIDLDTVMPGLSLYDVGDMVRTATCNAAEDEKDLSKIHMDIALFEQIARGFAVETTDFFTDSEKSNFAFAGKLITFEQMVRFLGDYLAGDVYYKIHREGHNLDRARTQMKLVQSIMEQEEQMNGLTESIWKESA
jgi:thiamine kinase-like enzyme